MSKGKELTESLKIERIGTKTKATMAAQMPVSSNGAAAEGDAGMDDQEAQMKKRQDQQNRQEDVKNQILSQVLDQNARARLSNIAAAKPEKAAMLENQIINMARFGQIRGKMDDEQLKSLLDKISEHTQKAKTTVKFDRRRAAIDSDDSD